MTAVTRYLIFSLTIIIFSLGFLVFSPEISLAQETERAPFESLVDLPYVDDSAADIGGYVNALYRLAIAAAAMLVVVKLIGAGAKYVLSDVVTNKEEAKKDIYNALLGLIIIIAAVAILNEINPRLLDIDVLNGSPTIDGGGYDADGGGGDGGGANPTPYILMAGETIRSCRGEDAATCQTEICGGGTVITGSYIRESGAEYSLNDSAACVMPSDVVPGDRDGDIVVAGVLINLNEEYTQDAIYALAAEFADQDVLESYSNIGTADRDREQTVCESNGGEAYFLKRGAGTGIAAATYIFCIK